MSERLVLAHGCSLSNLPLLVADECGFLADEGIESVAPEIEALAGTGELLASGRSSLGTAAFTLPLGMPTAPSAATAPADVVAVAGSGLRGISIMAQPTLAGIGALAGAVVGTFADDPLELLLREELHRAALGPEEVELRYLTSMPQAVEALLAGDVAAATVAEPYGARLRRHGFAELSDGTALWGAAFPDTVLVAGRALLEHRPEVVARAIRALRRAERLIGEDPAHALHAVGRHFPGFGADDLRQGLAAQPPQIDLRPLLGFLRDRWKVACELGLLAAAPFPSARVDLRLLDVELEAEYTNQGAVSP